jgi:5'-3' exonuclease
MSTYVLVDGLNLGYRVRYGMRTPDMETTVGLALHMIFHSIKKVWNQFDADTLVLALEGRSWRKDVYVPYKAHRREQAAARTPEEVEDDRMFFEAMDDFVRFMTDHTNVCVLQHASAEADDLIARWIQLHPDDSHVIVSTDSDFQQLLAPNVSIYNGISGLLYTHLGVWDKDGQAAKDAKGNLIKVPEPEWLLFEKIMRGDPGDNIMSAYPGVRKKKLQEAFDDRHQQGYAWNNLMLSKWQDHESHEIRVKDAYARNRMLIDLTCQPDNLVQLWDDHIQQRVTLPPKSQVGFHLLKFAHKWGLVKVEQTSSEHVIMLSASYKGHLLQSV